MFFKQPLKQLLQEETDNAISEHLVDRMDLIIEFLFVPNHSPVKKNCILKDIMQCLSKQLETDTKNSNWRLNKKILVVLEQSQGCFNLNQLNEIYCPVLFKVMEEGCGDLRRQVREREYIIFEKHLIETNFDIFNFFFSIT